MINQTNNRRNEHTYEPIEQSDLDRTRDEFLEEQDRLQKRKEEYSKTNLFKSRIINTEINASLLFQTVLYYNFFYAVMFFLIQIFSVSYKLWIFAPDNIAWTRLFLVPAFLIFELLRLKRGYSANLKEQFPDFIFFEIFSLVLIPPTQIILIIGKQVLPIDYATVLIELLFLIVEIFLSIRAMIIVTKRQAAVYYLRNTQTSVLSAEKSIKSSSEVEEELFFHFPHLRNNNLNTYSIGHIKKN